MFGKFCLFPVVNSLVMLFLIELFCECTELERSDYVQRCIRKESSFKNRSRCCCTLSYSSNKNEQLLRIFWIEKIHVSNLETLRNLIASLYLLVLQYKEGIVLHSICNYKNRPFFFFLEAVRMRCFQSFYICH